VTFSVLDPEQIGGTDVRILVTNAGSSSLKLSLFGPDGAVLDRQNIEIWTGEQDLGGLESYLATCGPVDAVGHRVVHGGNRFRSSVRIDDDVVDYLSSIADLAPLHNPRAVAAIRLVDRLLPELPAVAAFDTAYFSSMPAAASTYALPRAWNQEFALRRYGFHGLSHAFAVRRGAALAGLASRDLRVVTCHLGAGCSLAAHVGERVLDTTMGFTPLAGLVMQTRSGSIDPGLLLWLQQHGGIALDTLSDALEHRSGLRGLSGTSGDFREVLQGANAGDPHCQLAIDVYVHRLTREVGAMAASAGGLDLLIFTGGVGEHASAVRHAVCGRLSHLGVELDDAANRETNADGDVTAHGASARTVVVTAGEDTEVAREVRRLVEPG
jgi:acetate kinase